MFPGIGVLVIMRRGTGKRRGSGTRSERGAASRLLLRFARDSAAASTLRPASGSLQFFSSWNEEFFRRKLRQFSVIVTDKM
ncbi:hypothetical protein [Methylorubrum aminovorans]